MRSGSLGINIIVRDSEDTLPVCLQSIAGLWDELLVVDTGSKDSTPDIARSFGAEVLFFEWCYDFSAARNFGWTKLKTDYKCWVDSDDILCGREYFDDLMTKLESRGLDGVILEYLYAFDPVGERMLAEMEPRILDGSMSSDEVFSKLVARCVTTQHRERIIKNDPSWIWHYPIHEALPAAGKHLGKYDKVKIIHRRHVKKNPIPSKRNLDILYRVPLELRDERIWFYLGLENAHHYNLTEAIEAFEKYLPLGTVSDERYLALHFLGDLYRVKGDLDRSSAYDLQAVALRPSWRDAYAGLLETHVQKKEWNLAVYYGAMAQRAEVPETPFAYNPMHEEVGWVGDYVLALVEVGQLDEALKMAQATLEKVPEDTASQHNVDVLSVGANFRQGQTALAHAVEFLLRHDDGETAALILARLGPELREHPDLREWTRLVTGLCGQAASGGIVKDLAKKPPTSIETDFQGVWSDPRAKYFLEELAKRPEVRSVLQVGGALELQEFYRDLGIRAVRAERVSDIVGTYDAVMLWSCLERVKSPVEVVEKARACVVPGGWLFACVPNGPASKGLGPPRQEALRLRAYSPDTLRRVLGTWKFPDILPGWSAEAGDLWLSVPTMMSSGRPRAIAIVCPISPEPWGPWSLESGIGGSEEAVVRLSRAFARRGHSVVVYGSGWSGKDRHTVDGQSETVVEYGPISKYRASDIFIGWRYPEIFVNQVRPFEAQWSALWLHDSVGKERVEMAAPLVDLIWCISEYHAGLYSGVPRVFAGRNGIDPWEFRDDEVPFKHPAKMVYVSTPFRGLDVLLARFWPEIKRRVPTAELHCYYGWESADRMGVTTTPEGAHFKTQVMELVKQPGVVWHGRVGQPELYRELLSSGVWCYPTSWKEEHCISAYLAQAAGVWPVVYPIGALPQSVVFGWKVGEAGFVDAVCEAVQTDAGREEMAQWARRWLSWDSVAEHWERKWLGKAT